MKKSTFFPLLLAVTFLLSGCFALAEPEESSGTVAAPTLAAPQETEQVEAEPTDALKAAAVTRENEPADPYPAQDAPADEAYPAEEPNSAPEPPPAYPGTVVEVTEVIVTREGTQEVEGYPAPDTEPYPGPDAGQEAAGNSSVYEIDPARSEARFTINEVLRGAPKTVIGVSQNLGGQISLDINNPAAAQVGTILINARDFATDNEFRNNAIANEILLTNQYEFITFEPTAISGLPETAEIGQTYPFQITGNLTITDQTREVTFDAQVTPLSETELQGLASLDILYADFGLTIPFARSVESVEDNVLLELDFIAAQ